jgi:hypothetical protein
MDGEQIKALRDLRPSADTSYVRLLGGACD